MKNLLTFLALVLVPVVACGQSIGQLEEQAQTAQDKMEQSRQYIASKGHVSFGEPWDSKVDFNRLIAAWDSMEPSEIAECAHQLSVAEDALRTTLPKLTSTNLFSRALVVAADRQDTQTIDRIKQFADYRHNSDLLAKVDWAQNYLNDANSFQGGGKINPFTLSPQKRQALSQLIDAINRARVTDNLDLLRQMERVILADRNFRSNFNDDEVREIIAYIKHSEQYCNEIDEEEKEFIALLDQISYQHGGHGNHHGHGGNQGDPWGQEPEPAGNPAATMTGPSIPGGQMTQDQQNQEASNLGHSLADSLMNALGGLFNNSNSNNNQQAPPRSNYGPPPTHYNNNKGW